MSEAIYLFLGAAFVALVCVTVSVIHPNERGHLCAVASLTVTCGDVR